MSAPLGGGSVTTIASAQSSPFGVAVDSKSVYWLNPPQIVKIAK